MKYADIDRNDGYWGSDDDNLTKDGDTSSESGPPSPASSLRSGTPLTNGSSSSRDSRGLTKPPSHSLLMSTPTSSRMAPPIFTGSSSSAFASPRSSIEDSPGTPKGRKKWIDQAFQSAEKNKNQRSFAEPVTPTSKRTRPTARTPGFNKASNDMNEEQEVSGMVLTDTEPDSSQLSSVSLRLSISSERSFSSVGNPTRRTQLPLRSESMPLITPSPPFLFAQGTELGFQILAHNNEVQKKLDDMNISWGVQYELARGVTANLWTWEEIQTEQLQKLEGLNVQAAYKVANVMLNRPVSTKQGLSLWSELDKEQKAILEGKGRGVGLMGVWEGTSDWYGGRIQQVGRLYKEESKITIKLEAMEMRRSHRFARYCGSRRVLQIRIPDDIGDSADVRKFLCQKFVLCGRVFIAFHAKEGSVYMVETNENYKRETRNDLGDQHRQSISSFINWHNPFELNKKQALSKYSSRFALGLSNSIPVIEFEENHIHFIEDEIAAGWDKTKKPPAEKTMTDGCGFINRAGMMEITRRMKYGSRPTAVQARIGGAKGLWILDPERNDDHLPRIWIRDSQNKIKYTDYKDRSHRILELICVSQSSPPISLSSQSILNLSFNGVSEGTLITLLEKSIEDEVNPLTDWNKPMPCLWDAIAKAGHVSNTRAQRYATAGKSRALGLSRREWAPNFLKNEDAIPEGRGGDSDVGMNVDDEASGGEYAGRNKLSGSPFGLQEVALELIQAGFTPTDLGVLRDKIRYVVHGVIESAIEKYRIPLQESISAFVVPDPLGILKEGQIYYCSSQPLKDHSTQTLFTVLKGPVLIGRYPVRLACDIQLVTAVDVPQLSEWSDVVIVSTKGKRSAANILSGGDYDGDELFIIREKDLVEPFKNKPFVPEPENLQQECFEVNAETVEGFIQRTVILSTSNSQWEFQHSLLSGLNDSKMKFYSGFHEYAMFKYGYDHINTVKMAYMFGITLDSAKSGLKVKQDIFREHRAKFQHEIPLDANFILNKLMLAAKTKGDELLKKYDSIKNKDELGDLRRPWDDAFDKAKQFERDRNDAVFREELGMVMSHVQKAFDEWFSVCRKTNDKEEKGRQKKKRRRSRDDQEDPMIGVARFYSQGPAEVSFLQDVERLKASYATTLNIKFALAVAFQLVCDIKSKASANGYAPSLRMFDELKNMAPSALRVLAADQED